MVFVPRRKVRSSGSVAFVNTSRRPIDKSLVNVKQTSTTTQVETTLITATFPATITGVRWELAFSSLIATSSVVRWAIIRLKQSVVASILGDTDSASFYDPEQEVIAFGVIAVVKTDSGAGPMIQNISGTTKSMRKLMGGDRIVFITKSSVAVSCQTNGCVQFFAKT